MVNTRSVKRHSMSDNENNYKCNVVIRIHKEALMEFDKKSHSIPIVDNSLNIHLQLVSEKNDSNSNKSSVEDARTSNGNDSSTSRTVQFYKPASAMTLKTVDSAWKRCKKSKQNIKARDLVMAKLSGHPAWPAIVIEILPKKKAKVKFLGVEPHERYGFVFLSEIVLFKDSIDILLIQLKKKINRYKKAVLQAEVYGRIPQKYSLFNNF